MVDVSYGWDIKGTFLHQDKFAYKSATQNEMTLHK